MGDEGSKDSSHPKLEASESSSSSSVAGSEQAPRSELPALAEGASKVLRGRHEGVERRSSERFEVTWSVDCETEDTFLYASITNISDLGIFVRTEEPMPVGARLRLRFAPPHAGEGFVLEGTVQWINPYHPMGDNPNPGMGIRFVNLTADDRERLVSVIRTIAYLRNGTSQLN